MVFVSFDQDSLWLLCIGRTAAIAAATYIMLGSSINIKKCHKKEMVENIFVSKSKYVRK